MMENVIPSKVNVNDTGKKHLLPDGLRLETFLRESL